MANRRSINSKTLPQDTHRKFTSNRPSIRHMSTPPRILGGAATATHANEENVTVIRNLHRGGAECHGGGGDTPSVPEAWYSSREHAPLAAAADSARRRVRRALCYTIQMTQEFYFKLVKRRARRRRRRAEPGVSARVASTRNRYQAPATLEVSP